MNVAETLKAIGRPELTPEQRAALDARLPAPDYVAAFREQPPLTMRYDVGSDGWVIEQGDGTPVAWTATGHGQIVGHFHQKGYSLSDCLRAALATPGATRPI